MSDFKSCMTKKIIPPYLKEKRLGNKNLRKKEIKVLFFFFYIV